MRNFYRKGEDIYEFESDGSQDHLITDEFVRLTEEEVERHLYPQRFLPDYDPERERLSMFIPLTRRQFMRTLVLQGYDLDLIEAQINLIEDKPTRQLALIDWKESTEFRRTDDTLIMMATLLGLSTPQIDAMWEFGLRL